LICCRRTPRCPAEYPDANWRITFCALPPIHVFDSTGYGVNLPNSDINLAEGVNCLLKPYDDITPVRAVKKAFANGN